MKNGQPRKKLEGRRDQIVVVLHAANRGVRVETGQDGVVKSSGHGRQFSKHKSSNMLRLSIPYELTRVICANAVTKSGMMCLIG
jgi:hypothetical protein